MKLKLLVILILFFSESYSQIEDFWRESLFDVWAEGNFNYKKTEFKKNEVKSISFYDEASINNGTKTDTFLLYQNVYDINGYLTTSNWYYRNQKIERINLLEYDSLYNLKKIISYQYAKREGRIDTFVVDIRNEINGYYDFLRYNNGALVESRKLTLKGDTLMLDSYEGNADTALYKRELIFKKLKDFEMVYSPFGRRSDIISANDKSFNISFSSTSFLFSQRINKKTVRKAYVSMLKNGTIEGMASVVFHENSKGKLKEILTDNGSRVLFEYNKKSLLNGVTFLHSSGKFYEKHIYEYSYY